MNKKRKKWIESITMLSIEAEDLYDENNPEKYDMIMQILEEYYIANLTIRDMRDFVKRDLGLVEELSNEEIFEYIMNKDNREKLIRLGQIKNPIDTRKYEETYRKSLLSDLGLGEELRW